MGGQEKLQAIQTITMKDGTGTRFSLNQTMKAGDPEEPAQLKNVVETLDLSNGLASLDYELTEGAFMQHRHEILTKRGEGAGAKPVGIEIVPMRPIVATSVGGL